MTIEIRKPELEALIKERMKTGGFQSVEDVLIQALNSPLFATHPSPEPITRTGAELVAAMQSSPYKDIEIEPARSCLPVRGVGL
jgi:hypothetical protein